MRHLLSLAGVLRLAGLSFAQETTQREDLRDWEYFSPLQGNGPAGQLARVELGPKVFGKARVDLNDLRLIDNDGGSVSYTLRVMAARYRREVLSQSRVFDRVTLPDKSQRLSVDLGENPPEHNEIRLDIAAPCYSRPLVLESSMDGEDWSVLLDKVEVVYLEKRGKEIDLRSVDYPPSRSRYLRVTLGPDRVGKAPDRQLKDVQILYRLDIPEELSQGTSQWLSREPVRLNGEAASEWLIGLGEDHVPVTQLQLDIEQAQFDRPFQLSLYEPGQRTTHIINGNLSRSDGSEKVLIGFPEVKTRWLKLTVLDSRNTPLTLRGVTYRAPARLVVFPIPKDKKSLRLYYGNPTANAPRYDFAATVPAMLPELVNYSAGERQENPEYVPPPPPFKPWTERYPLVLDGILVVALLLLLALLVRLATTAIRRHDEAVATEG